MSTRSRRVAITVTLTLAVVLIAVPTAGAMYISGQQKIVDESAGKYKMTGGIKGKWEITKFHVKDTSPVFKAKGEEKFNGCIDVDRDGSCTGDPSGKLKFTFRYWGSFTESDELQLGTCAHRIVKAKGGLKGANGFLMMVDTPTKSPPGVKTQYEGDINLGGSHHRSAIPKREGC